jgi:hypothetical protein
MTTKLNTMTTRATTETSTQNIALPGAWATSALAEKRLLNMDGPFGFHGRFDFDGVWA